MNLNFESVGGDGVSGGEFNRAKLLGGLLVFLSDPINLLRASTAMLSAPPDDQELLDETIANLQAGFDPGEHAIEAVLDYTRIFCGRIIRGDGSEELDICFIDDPEE